MHTLHQCTLFAAAALLLTAIVPANGYLLAETPGSAVNASSKEAADSRNYEPPKPDQDKKSTDGSHHRAGLGYVPAGNIPVAYHGATRQGRQLHGYTPRNCAPYAGGVFPRTGKSYVAGPYGLSLQECPSAPSSVPPSGCQPGASGGRITDQPSNPSREEGGKTEQPPTPQSSASGLPPDYASSLANVQSARTTMASQYASTPNQIGPFLGGGAGKAILPHTISYGIITHGFIQSGAPGSADAIVGFDADDVGAPIDFTTSGLGRDTNGDRLADTFDMTEPNGTNIPTSPGPTFTYRGGIVTVTNPPGSPFMSGDEWYAAYAYTENVVVAIPDPGMGGTVGRVRLTDDFSAIPRDRAFFDYYYFNNTPLLADGVDINRFTPGVEKTFFNGLASLELRLPMAVTADSTMTADGRTDLTATEFGDLHATGKLMVFRNHSLLLSTGLGVSVPTANSVRVQLQDGTKILEVKNRAVYVTPFVGGLWLPNENTFIQGYMLIEIDVNGNPILMNPTGTGLAQVGRANGQTAMLLNLSYGRWVYHDDHRTRGLSGIALAAEGYYMTSLQNADVVRLGNFQAGAASPTFDQFNVTVGAHLRFGRRSMLSIGYAAPIGGNNQTFDGELHALMNYWF